jgi:hypothetical protein
MIIISLRKVRFKPLNCLDGLLRQGIILVIHPTASDAASALFPQNCMRFKLYHILWTLQIAGFALAGKIC